jgi:hypothetical protein
MTLGQFRKRLLEAAAQLGIDPAEALEMKVTDLMARVCWRRWS